MSFNENHEVGRNAEFKRITEIAILKVGTQVAGEDTTGMQPVVATKRATLANNVFYASKDQAVKFAMHLASLGTISVTVDDNGDLNYTGGGSLDADVEFSVSSIWNDRAGVTYDDLNP